jgi:hypothetical protein
MSTVEEFGHLFGFALEGRCDLEQRPGNEESRASKFRAVESEMPDRHDERKQRKYD